MQNVGGVRGRGLGRGQRPRPSKKEIVLYILHRGNLLYIYITPRTTLAMLTPTPSPLAVSKSYFFSSDVFRVCAYLPTDVAVYRMVLDLFVW